MTLKIFVATVLWSIDDHHSGRSLPKGGGRSSTTKVLENCYTKFNSVSSLNDGIMRCMVICYLWQLNNTTRHLRSAGISTELFYNVHNVQVVLSRDRQGCGQTLTCFMTIILFC